MYLKSGKPRQRKYYPKINYYCEACDFRATCESLRLIHIESSRHCFLCYIPLDNNNKFAKWYKFENNTYYEITYEDYIIDFNKRKNEIIKDKKQIKNEPK